MGRKVRLTFWAIVSAIALAYMLLLGSCARFDSSVAHWAEVMNSRNVKSCATWDAYLRGSDIAGGRVRAVTVTGGASMEWCHDFWLGQISF